MSPQMTQVGPKAADRIMWSRRKRENRQVSDKIHRPMGFALADGSDGALETNVAKMGAVLASRLVAKYKETADEF